jgi:hypothetical protein
MVFARLGPDYYGNGNCEERQKRTQTDTDGKGDY